VETPNEITWPESVWRDINDDVVKEVGKVRVGQRVFPTTTFDTNPTQIPDEVIDFVDLTIKEGATKPFVEIYVEFSLTSTQVKQEAEQRTCRTLARMSAKALALAEDTYFFQTSNRAAKRDPDSTKSDVKFPAKVKVDNWRTDRDLGLLAEANPDKNDDAADSAVAPTLVTKPIDVYLADVGNAKWGENTFNAVSEGIPKLVGKAQAPNYALVLPTEVYADTFTPPSPPAW
jgi:uncharacterized linocin/CFP29 family protein